MSAKKPAGAKPASPDDWDNPDLNEASALLDTVSCLLARLVAASGEGTDLAHAAKCATERAAALLNEVITAKLRGGAA